MIAKVCDRESRRDTWFENRLVSIMVRGVIYQDFCDQNFRNFIDFQPDFVCFSPILRYFSGIFINLRIFPEKLITPLYGRPIFSILVNIGWGSRLTDFSLLRMSKFKIFKRLGAFSLNSHVWLIYSMVGWVSFNSSVCYGM